MLEHKRAATKVVKGLGLQADLRARAVVLVAADSEVGDSLRDMIQLNEDDPALKALVEELLRGEATGQAMLCTDNMRFGKIFTADVSPIVLAKWNVQHVVYAFTDFWCLLNASRLNAILGNMCSHIFADIRRSALGCALTVWCSSMFL